LFHVHLNLIQILIIEACRDHRDLNCGRLSHLLQQTPMRCRHHIRDVLIPLKYTFLSTILFGLSVSDNKKENLTGKGKIQKRHKTNSETSFSTTTTTPPTPTQDSLILSSNSLQKLNRLGEEGVLDFKKELADYLGVKFPLKIMQESLYHLNKIR